MTTETMKPKNLKELVSLRNEEIVKVKAENNQAKYQGLTKYVGKIEEGGMKGLHYFRAESAESGFILPMTAKEENILINDSGEIIIKNVNYHKNNRGLISSDLFEKYDYARYLLGGVLNSN
jgi:hypothetical protein